MLPFSLGATLEEHPMPGDDPPKMNGSALIAVAESKEDVLALLKEDIYSTSGVWDLARVSSRLSYVCLGFGRGAHGTLCVFDWQMDFFAAC